MLLGGLLASSLLWRSAAVGVATCCGGVVAALRPADGRAVAYAVRLGLITLKWPGCRCRIFPAPTGAGRHRSTTAAILLESTWHSLRLLLSGYFVGVAAGLVSGVLIGWFPAVRYWGMPVLKVVGPIPATALVPLAMMLFPATRYLLRRCRADRAGGLVSGDDADVLGHRQRPRVLPRRRPDAGGGAAVPDLPRGHSRGVAEHLPRPVHGAGRSFLTLIVAETVGVKAGLGWYLQWRRDTRSTPRCTRRWSSWRCSSRAS